MFTRQYTVEITWNLLKTELSQGIVDKYAYQNNSQNGFGDPIVDMYFNEALTQPEIDELDAAVLVHVPTIKEYKIYDMVQTTVVSRVAPPFEVNYKSGLSCRLSPKYTFVKGELQKVEFYESSTTLPNFGQLYDNIMLEVDFTYTRDAAGFAVSRTKDIGWYFVDDTLSPIRKLMTKHYTNDQSIREGKRRRGNIIDQMQLPIIGMMIQAAGMTQTDAILEGRSFSAFYRDQINNFIEVSHKQIITDITNDTTHTWLNAIISADPLLTIRDFIIGELTIPGSIE